MNESTARTAAAPAGPTSRADQASAAPFSVLPLPAAVLLNLQRLGY